MAWANKILKASFVGVTDYGRPSDATLGFSSFESNDKPRNPLTTMDNSHVQMVNLIWNIADDVLVMRRIRRSENSLYRDYNQIEGFQGIFRNRLRKSLTTRSTAKSWIY